LDLTSSIAYNNPFHDVGYSFYPIPIFMNSYMAQEVKNERSEPARHPDCGRRLEHREVFENKRRGGLRAANCTCRIWENLRDTMIDIAGWKQWLCVGICSKCSFQR
jgi:hypothetical protein